MPDLNYRGISWLCGISSTSSSSSSSPPSVRFASAASPAAVVGATVKVVGAAVEAPFFLGTALILLLVSSHASSCPGSGGASICLRTFRDEATGVTVRKRLPALRSYVWVGERLIMRMETGPPAGQI